MGEGGGAAPAGAGRRPGSAPSAGKPARASISSGPRHPRAGGGVSAGFESRRGSSGPPACGVWRQRAGRPRVRLCCWHQRRESSHESSVALRFWGQGSRTMSLRGRTGQAFPGRRLSQADPAALGCGRFRTRWDGAGARAGVHGPLCSALVGSGRLGAQATLSIPERSDAGGRKHAGGP